MPKSVTAIVILTLVIVLGWAGYKAAEVSLKASVEHKSAHSGTGTIVSKSELNPVDTPGTAQGRSRYILCFTIDDWGRVRDSDLATYEAAERQRQLSFGPRCETFDDAPAVTVTRPGDTIQIVYLLENNSQIVVARVGISGVEFVPGVTEVFVAK